MPANGESSQVICLGERLEPHGIVREVVAGEARPIERVLPLFDPLLRRPTTVVELHDLRGPQRPSRHDESKARPQLTGMPFRPDDNSTRLLPTGKSWLRSHGRLGHRSGRRCIGPQQPCLFQQDDLSDFPVVSRDQLDEVDTATDPFAVMVPSVPMG